MPSTVDVTVRDPRTGVTRIVPGTDARDLPAVSARLRSAQADWCSRSAEARGAVLSDWAGRIEGARDDLVAALVADTGRLRESVIEVDAVIGMVRRWAAAAPALLQHPSVRDASVPGFAVHQAFVPYALVGVISPWNFPLLLSLIDTIPALAAGCAVLVKPSEVTPSFVPVLASTVTSPDGDDLDVLAFVVGGGDLGAAVVDHVDQVCFTGSVPTGRRVARQAAENMIPANLELGGKDPAIVLPGLDRDGLQHAAHAVLWGATSNAGQACQSIERVYVPTESFDEFLSLLVPMAEAVGLALPSPSDPGLGPIISLDQVQVIERHLADAVSRGAVAVTGGEVEHLGGGAWLRPTVLTGVDHSMLVMREETFGPIIPAMAYGTVDEAVELANDTEYGLSAAVLGPSTDACLAVASRLQAGAVSINDCSLTALVHDAEKQSFGLSGMGRSRMGPDALLRFGRRTAAIENVARRPDPWWWPTP